MPRTSLRTSSFGESVIRGMTRLADECGAINLSQGFPDFDPPEPVLRAAERAGRHGPHQYAITWGALEFRRALARKQSRFMGLELDPNEHMVITCGSTEAMMVAMMTACNPGDRVIVFSPFYENYSADAILCGAEPVHVTLYPPDFRFDPEELRGAFRRGAKALVLCNPANPSGKVFSRDELMFIASLAEAHDTFVLTDEVYEHIVYRPREHTYFASLPGMFARTLSCSSLSKTYSMTGWRLGYVIATPEIIGEARKVHDFLTVGAAAPLQQAAVTALELPDSYYGELQALYTKKRDEFLEYLRAAGLVYTEPQGAYYVMVDISEFAWASDLAFCEWLARQVGVAAVPGSSFFHEPINHLIRLHFAKRSETLSAAGERLLKIRERMPRASYNARSEPAKL
ncbi:MAG: aminotransferase class I/II-fold pyridoxal phosphate-dependent enzyme [Acidobacteria bacterium]|nr:aminotransferase class I/II-fold pyridoxal phosphate-dependent enzyme [Acidobacteriota bacterium]